jgi:hypothetical protein
MLCFHEGARPSVLSITTHHHVVFSRKGTSLCYQSQLIIMLCFHERGTSLRAINHNHHVSFTGHVPPCYHNHNSSSCCVFTRHVLSITTHHHGVFTKGTSLIMLCFRKGHVLRAINHNSSSCCVFHRGRPPCYQSQLMFMLAQRHLRAINHNSSSCCVFTKRHVPVLSITTHHRCVFTKGTSLRAINHNSSSCCVFTKGTSLRAINHNSSSSSRKHVPPCYQSQLIIMLPLKHVPPCYQSQLIIIVGFHETSSVLSITTHHVVFHERGTSSVLSITTHRCVSRKGHVPPCYQSQLIIMLCFHERHVPPCYQSQLIIMLFTKGTSLRAINHNSSSCCVFTRARPSVHQSQSSSCVSRKGHVPPCYQSQLIMLCSRKARPSVLSITTHHVVFRKVPVMLCTKGTSLRAITTHHHVVFSRGTSSVLSITTHHHVVFSRKARPPCYHNSSSCCVFTKGTSSVLSITTHHHVVFSRRHVLRAINHNSSSCVHERHVPPCYQSQLIIMLCFHERHVLRAINHNSSSCCVTKGTSSVLSITTHHHVVFTKARPSVLSITTHHHVVFHERHVPPCYQSQLMFVHEKARPSVLSITTHHVVFSRKARPSVLSITTHHHVVFSRGTSLSSCCVFTKGARPPCYQSQLIIMLCFHERHVPPCYQSQLIIMLCRKGHVPPANHNSSSCCVFTKRHAPCYQSQLIIMLSRKGTSSVLSITNSSSFVFSRKASSVLSITTHHHKQRPSVLSITTHHHVRPKARPSVLSITTHHHVAAEGRSSVINHNSSSCCVLKARPPCYQSQLIIMLCFHEKARPSVINQLIIRCVFTKGNVLRAINHNSSCCVSRKARPPCYQSQLIIMLF